MTLKLCQLIHWKSIKSGAFVSKNQAENVQEKLIPDPFLILVNNPKFFYKSDILKENL